MAYKGLHDYIHTLRTQGELIEIDNFINPNLEITEITDRISKQEGGKNKALLFTNTGTDFPLLINGFGSESRINLALNAPHLQHHAERIFSLFSKTTAPKQSLSDALKMLPLLAELKSWMPKIKKGKGDCQAIIHTEPNLHTLPILTCWPHDGGKFITLPMVITKHPETGIRNVGMYRMQVIDGNTTAMHWHLHKTGANHYKAYKEKKERMPIAVALGGDPSHTFSATAPLPENIDEFMLSGFLRQKSVELVKCITQDIYVPADADIIIEGYVDPQEELFYEGPFGDHTGFYSLPDYFPKFHITCITHKKQAVYPATIVGIPPMEDAWIGKATERIFLAPIKLLLAPELLDYWMPFEGVAHNLVIAQIKKEFAGQAQKVINTLWGAGQMMFNKSIIIIDQNSSTSIEAICSAIMNNCTIQEDIIIQKGPLDILDHAAPITGYGSKIGIDATQKTYNTPTNKEYDTLYEIIYADIDEDTEKIIESQASQLAKFYIICDKALENCNANTIIWHVLGNLNPIKDCIFIAHKGTDSLRIDGRTKPQNYTQRDWPTPVVSSQETIDTIDEKWDSIGIGEFIPSPSNHYKQLVQKESAWYYSHTNNKIK